MLPIKIHSQEATIIDSYSRISIPGVHRVRTDLNKQRPLHCTVHELIIGIDSPHRSGHSPPPIQAHRHSVKSLAILGKTESRIFTTITPRHLRGICLTTSMTIPRHSLRTHFLRSRYSRPSVPAGLPDASPARDFAPTLYVSRALVLPPGVH